MNSFRSLGTPRPISLDDGQAPRKTRRDIRDAMAPGRLKPQSAEDGMNSASGGIKVAQLIAQLINSQNLFLARQYDEHQTLFG